MISEEEAVTLFGPLGSEELEGLDVQQRDKKRRQRLFLRGFALSGVVMDGLLAAQVARSTEQFWRSSDKEYAALFKIAEEHAADIVEKEAIRRAVHGYEEPVIFQGQPTIITDAETGEERVYTTRKYSDSLMTLVLKGRRREKYGDKIEQTVDTKRGGVVVVPGTVLEVSAWEKAAREMQSDFAGNKGEE